MGGPQARRISLGYLIISQLNTFASVLYSKTLDSIQKRLTRGKIPVYLEVQLMSVINLNGDKMFRGN